MEKVGSPLLLKLKSDAPIKLPGRFGENQVGILKVGRVVGVGFSKRRQVTTSNMNEQKGPQKAGKT